MRSLDSNVVLRYLLDDSPDQVAVSKQILSEPSLIVATVVLEIIWVLASRPDWPPNRIRDGIIIVLELPQVRCRDGKALRWALARYVAGADFPDMLHLALSSTATSFVTFDKRIARHADASVVPVETLCPTPPPPHGGGSPRR